MAPFKMDRPMGQVRSLDQKLNEAGYLRLTTNEPLIKHLGNRLGKSDSLRSENGNNPAQHIQRRSSLNRLYNLPVVRRSLLRLYDQIFRLYFTPRD